MSVVVCGDLAARPYSDFLTERWSMYVTRQEKKKKKKKRVATEPFLEKRRDYDGVVVQVERVNSDRLMMNTVRLASGNCSLHDRRMTREIECNCNRERERENG
jgi:hypothetical protein